MSKGTGKLRDAANQLLQSFVIESNEDIIVGELKHYLSPYKHFTPYIEGHENIPVNENWLRRAGKYREYFKLFPAPRLFKLLYEARPDLANEIMAADDAGAVWFRQIVRQLKQRIVELDEAAGSENQELDSSQQKLDSAQ